jgi:hypothetical protein
MVKIVIIVSAPIRFKLPRIVQKKESIFVSLRPHGSSGGGALVNVLSVLSLLNLPAAGTYGASKAAAWALTNGVRNELRTTTLPVHRRSTRTGRPTSSMLRPVLNAPSVGGDCGRTRSLVPTAHL